MIAEQRPVISVIVPIYNVEAYLPKCLDSLKRQTLANVEFLLVDDGSTDRSGAIAEQYRDDRFRVFHTENHGLSAARNLGIEQSRGEWLMFVDGDDWVEPGFCEIPYREAIKTGADLVIFEAFSEIHGRIKKRNNAHIPVGIVSIGTAVKLGRFAAWNKFYRRGLFNEIRYPVGMVYEDVVVTQKLINTAHHIAMIPDNLYCHVCRRGSISRTLSFESRRDCFIADCLRYDYLARNELLVEKNEQILLSPSIGLLASCYSSNDPVYRIAKTIVNSTRHIPKDLSMVKKTAFILWKWNRPVFHLVCFLIRWVENL